MEFIRLRKFLRRRLREDGYKRDKRLYYNSDECARKHSRTISSSCAVPSIHSSIACHRPRGPPNISRLPPR